MAPDDRTLSERRGAILRALVSHYVVTGDPVASKTLVDRYRLNVSPATVRNELGALEDAGFIYQPHTSAGRIPTDAGYRYFVDGLAADPRLPGRDARRIRQFFGEPRWELEEALRETASLLSSLTEHAALVFAPALQRSVVRHVELVDLSSGRAMLVVVTNTGRVENHIITAAGLDEIQLQQAAGMLNRALHGVGLEQAGDAVSGALERFPLELREVASAVAVALRDALSDDDNRVFLEGTSNIVDEHKFADLETVRQVIETLEHRRLLLEVVADGLASGTLSVRIGSENPVEDLQSCSVITAPYGAEGQVVGSLGVVGPTRMDYGRSMAAVHEVAAQLGRMLNEISG